MIILTPNVLYLSKENVYDMRALKMPRVGLHNCIKQCQDTFYFLATHTLRLQSVETDKIAM